MHITSPSYSNYFVDDETWVVNTTDNQGYGAWLEAGESTWSYSHTTQVAYFWAEDLNNGQMGGVYNQAAFGLVSSTDYGQNATINIYLASNGTTWYVGVDAPSKNYFTDETRYVMDTPNEWQLGMELYGNSNQSAGESYFTHNTYLSATDGNYYPETVEGTPKQALPPNASWIIKPNGTNDGGKFATICYC